MSQSSEYLPRPLVANYESAEGLQPRVTSLYDPSPLVPLQLAPVLMRGNSVVVSRWNNLFNPPIHPQRSDYVAIVPSIADQSLWLATLMLAGLHFDTGKCRLDEFDFRRGSLLQVYSERSTRATRGLGALRFQPVFETTVDCALRAVPFRELARLPP